jgi:hypothetical protein
MHIKPVRNGGVYKKNVTTKFERLLERTMKRIRVALILLGLLNMPGYSHAELSPPTGVKATEGTYSNAIIISWNPVADATYYEIWRDDYSGCIEQLPCEPEFIYWQGANGTQIVDYLNSEWDLYYDVVFEYRIKARTGESSISDFSLPAYGYISKEGTYYNSPDGYWNFGSGGGGGIFGDIIKSSVIGYHFDGFTTQGVQVYMPVTKGFKALKGAQEYVRNFVPQFAVTIREGFDFLEQQADANKEGVLYNIGTYIFPILGELAGKILKVIGEEKYIDAAYSDTTISVEEFNKLKRRGQAITPKVVKDREISQQEKIFTYTVN